MLQAPQVKHAHASILTTAHKYIDALGTEPYVIYLLVVGNQLRLGREGWNVPYCAGGINARGNDEAGGDGVPVERRQRGRVIGCLGV